MDAMAEKHCNESDHRDGLCGRQAISEDLSFRLSSLKFIAIIAVVYIHSFAEVVHLQTGDLDLNKFKITSYVENFISHEFMRFAVPLLFSISGFIYFLKGHQGGYLSFLWKKIKSILCPYLLWNTICVAYMYVLQSVPFAKKYFAKGLISSWNFDNWISAYIGFGEAWYPYLYPLWFLLVLFGIFAIIPLLKKYFVKWPFLIALLCISHILLYGFHFSWDATFSLNRYVSALSFFCFGYLLSLHLKKIDTQLTLISSGFVFLTLCIFPTIYPSLSQGRVLREFNAYVGIVFLFSLSQFFPTLSPRAKKRLLALSSFSFLIYLTHENFLSIAKKLLYSLLPLNFSCTPLILFLLLPVAVIGVLLIFGFILKKSFPKIYSLLFIR